MKKLLRITLVVLAALAAMMPAPARCQVGTLAPQARQGLRYVKVSLSAAQINGMYAAPVQLIAAQGSGKSIIISKVAFTITRTSTAFANGGAAIIQYGSTTHGGGTQACDSTLASTVITGSAGTSYSVRNGAVISDSTVPPNAGIYLSNATGAFDTGTGTAVAEIWYYVAGF